MPKILPTLAIGGMVALSLVACSAPAASACPVTPSGSASSKVVVTGKAGAEPTVTFPAPLEAPVTERSVITEGDGEVVEPGMLASANFVLYNAATGERLDGSPDFASDGSLSFVVDESRVLSGIAKTVECSTVGSRIVGVVPPGDAFGADGPNFGVGADESLVFVFDIRKVEPTPSAAPGIPHRDRADGTPVAPEDGFPAVTLDADGTPTVTIPDAAPPTELKLETLMKGDGDTVPDGASVVVHYTGVNWTTGEVFDSSWTRGTPSTFKTSQVIKGFAAAIVGQTVGSQVVVVIPPADGYGPNGNPPKISGTDVLVFVVDILGFAP